MKTIPILLITLMAAALANAQSVERALVASSGGQLANGSVKVTQSIGEAVTGDISNSSNTAHQGYQQANDFIVSFKSAMNSGVEVFPNPFTNSIVIKQSSFQYMKLYDMQGKLVREVNLASSTQIDLSDLADGLYHLKLISSNSNIISTHQVQKL